MVKRISDKTSDLERAFYGSKEIAFSNITIDGPADGESAFKECSNISVIKSTFNLRYPFWHNKNLKVKNSVCADTCRAGFWYDENVSLFDVKSNGIKAFRECKNVTLEKCNFVSDEIFWNVDNLVVKDSTISGVYAFFGSKQIVVKNVKFSGKYSFQYTKNVIIENAVLDTKDAFWHAKNVLCKNCEIKGEYLAWYSEGLTLVNCVISGTQPLCYAKKLHLIDCKFKKADLCFEYSEVNGNIIGNIDSIKNPLKGKLTISGKTNYIKDENDRSKGKFKLKY